MREIPEHIKQRCEFAIEDQICKVRSIIPIEPCVCGRTLTDTRITRLQRNSSPHLHWREYCYSCKLVNIVGENNWQTADQLNREMRTAAFNQKNQEKNIKD